MKKLSLLTLLFTYLFFNGQVYANPGNGKLMIGLDNLPASKGIVHVVLFNQPEGFPYLTENSYMSLRIDLADENAAREFASIPFGKYAILVYLDVDGNGKLSRNWLGKSKEAYGYSNYPPSATKELFDACAFMFTEDGQMVSLKLNNAVCDEKAGEGVASGK